MCNLAGAGRKSEFVSVIESAFVRGSIYASTERRAVSDVKKRSG